MCKYPDKPEYMSDSDWEAEMELAKELADCPYNYMDEENEEASS